MQDITETRELLWTAGFALVAAVLVFAVLAGVTWVATALGSWAGTF
jgi:hypothetical protein